MDRTVLEQYVAFGLSIREIAKLTDSSYSNVRYYLKKYGIVTLKHRFRKSEFQRCNQCGETDPALFYGGMYQACGKCHNRRCIENARKKRQRALNLLGSACAICGFDKHTCALDFHHMNPSEKDPNFKGHAGWSLKRILQELRGCVLVCRNCHAAVTVGLLTVPDDAPRITDDMIGIELHKPPKPLPAPRPYKKRVRKGGS